MPDESIPAGTTLLLKGGLALTPDTDWHDPPSADIAIAGDKIVGVCPGYPFGEDRNVQVIDARDHLALPGFVNAHYHSHDVLAKGTPEEVPLESWRLYDPSLHFDRRGIRYALSECGHSGNLQLIGIRGPVYS